MKYIVKFIFWGLQDRSVRKVFSAKPGNLNSMSGTILWKEKMNYYKLY